MNPYAAQLYIDGSCYKNPGGSGGLAGLLEMPDSDSEPEVIFQEGYRSTTNNRMEITALIRALEYVKANALNFRESGLNQVEIRPDSNTAIMCYRSAEEWRANSWKGLNDQPITNVDLIKRILTLKNTIGFSCRIEHIQNKSTDATIQVDKLAKQAAKKPTKDDTGYIEAKVCHTDISGPTLPFNAQGQKIEIKIFAHYPVSKKKDSLYKAKFEINNAGCSEKYFAHCSSDVNNVLHRHHYYKVKFNNDKNNPIIEEASEKKVRGNNKKTPKS
jgi:ribonuclease HI